LQLFLDLERGTVSLSKPADQATSMRSRKHGGGNLLSSTTVRSGRGYTRGLRTPTTNSVSESCTGPITTDGLWESSRVLLRIIQHASIRLMATMVQGLCRGRDAPLNTYIDAGELSKFRRISPLLHSRTPHPSM